VSIHIDRLKLLEALNVVDEVKAKLPPVTEASYIVYEEEGTYYAKNGRTGQVEFSSSSAKEAIQYAIDSLTPGRNWIETVVLKGKFTLDDTIMLPSYTRIVLNGLVRLANGVNKPLLRTVPNAVYFVIEGGVWDGNKANQTEETAGFYIDEPDKPDAHSLIHKVVIMNVRVTE
jgi:hypothetical protein